jgi:anti-sigma regulatory factor (Ser/Thr protein kinase)
MRSEAELRLPPQFIAPTLARAAITAMSSGLPDDVVSDVELLTSEVVSNAVKHAKLSPSDEIIVRFVMDGYVRVEVVDPGPPFDARPTRPNLASQDPDSNGWGLLVVDAVATSWGVEPEGAGKKVWFEVGHR